MFLSIQQKFILDTLKKLNCVRRRQLHTLVRGRFQQDGFEITQICLYRCFTNLIGNLCRNG